MKRRTKLMLLLGILALLLGATLLVTMLEPGNEAREEEPKTVVFSVDPEAITELGWDYSEKVLFRAGEDGWVLDGDSTFPVETGYLDRMRSALSEITASKTIEGVENWDQYGLEVPVCTVTVTTDTTYTLSIGLETGISGERYFSNGDGKVYLVDASLLDTFSYGLYDVLKYETIPDMDAVTGLEVVSDAQAYTITRRENSGLTYSDDYVWFWGEKALDTERTEDLISTVTDLYWYACVNYNAADLSRYGLETPAARVTVTYQETSAAAETEQDAAFSLELGTGTDGGSYARIAGSRMVYSVDPSVLDTLLYTTDSELQPDEVLRMNWEELVSMDVILDGQTYSFVRSTKTVTGEDGTETEETVYTLNGEEMKAQTILDALDGISSTGYATGLTPERSEEIRFVFRRDRETFPEVELEFYKYDSTSCMTTLNGAATVFADREAVVALVEAVNALVLG